MNWQEAFIKNIPDCKFTENMPLRGWTTFKVGGPAALFAEPQSENALCSLLDQIRKTNIPFLLMGNGSNLLIRDGGFDGLVIHVGAALNRISAEGTKIRAQSGAILSKTAVAAMEHGLKGLAFAHGIPGSLGGAIYMNAGAYGGDMSHVVESVRVWTPAGIREYTNQEMEYSYRHSRLMEEESVVLSAVLFLQRGDKEEIRAEMTELLRRRKEKQPLEYPSAGSFFKRPQGHFAGQLIEEAGLKGYTVGDAQVSEKHAGFVINRGNASAKDILQLMQDVQNKIYERTGIKLEAEVRITGREK